MSNYMEDAVNQEGRDRLVEAMERDRSLGGQVRYAVRTTLWFGLPFGVMWGAGLAVEDAARMAIAPWACSVVCGWMVMGMAYMLAGMPTR